VLKKNARPPSRNVGFATSILKIDNNEEA
jgi:hypothetical protein